MEFKLCESRGYLIINEIDTCDAPDEQAAEKIFSDRHFNGVWPDPELYRAGGYDDSPIFRENTFFVSEEE